VRGRTKLTSSNEECSQPRPSDHVGQPRRLVPASSTVAPHPSQVLDQACATCVGGWVAIYEDAIGGHRLRVRLRGQVQSAEHGVASRVSRPRLESCRHDRGCDAQSTGTVTLTSFDGNPAPTAFTARTRAT
jgi:hypothetical protein